MGGGWGMASRFPWRHPNARRACDDNDDATQSRSALRVRTALMPNLVFAARRRCHAGGGATLRAHCNTGRRRGGRRAHRRAFGGDREGAVQVQFDDEVKALLSYSAPIAR